MAIPTTSPNKCKMADGGTVGLLDEDICEKFGTKIQHDHAETPT